MRSVTRDANCNLALFTGEWQDPSGLIYLRARYYDPDTGRFLTRDTYPGELADPGTLHPYVYCGNNPVVYVDPTGHLTICDAISEGRLRWGAVPYAPPGVDIDENILKAKGMTPWEFYRHVNTGGPWDYKEKGSEYEDFGNFNYGATAQAVGFPPGLVLRMAGWKQRQTKTSRPEFGVPWGSPPYGDDPHDQEMIRRGIEYYQRNYGYKEVMATLNDILEGDLLP